MLETLNNTEQAIVCTTTGELFMPVRLYYKIHNKNLLIKTLSKLKCVELEFDNKSFVISYYKEAKNLGLKVHYQNVPEELYPIALAHCFIKPNSILHIDLKSLKRATCIIDLLSKYISPAIMEITDLASSNKHTTSINNENNLEEILNMSYDQLFDEKKMLHTDFESRLSELKEIYEETQTKILEEKKEAEEYPDVEKISINYSKKSHNDLIMLLTIRSVIKEGIAVKRYKGDKDYAPMDVIKDLTEMMGRDMKEQGYDKQATRYLEAENQTDQNQTVS